jgi:hypothetical protein
MQSARERMNKLKNPLQTRVAKQVPKPQSFAFYASFLQGMRFSIVRYFSSCLLYSAGSINTKPLKGQHIKNIHKIADGHCYFLNTTCSARLTCLMMALELAVVGILRPSRSPRLMYSRSAGRPSSSTPTVAVES